MKIPLEILDREIARAAGSVRAARAELAHGEEDAGAPSPLAGARRVSTRATYAELEERAAPGAPEAELAAAVRAWVAALTLDRVLWSDEVRHAAAWHAESIQIDHADLVRAIASPRSVLASMLSEAEAPRRRLWAGVLEGGATGVADAARILAERRAEAARLLRADLDALEVPCAPAEIAAAARELLARSAPLIELRAKHWSDGIVAGLGRAAAAGWPSRLAPRWIEELFRSTGLTEGLRVALDPLPRALGAASFGLALGVFGGALADADAPRSGPFSLANRPFDLRRARRAALFAGLVADPEFHARALGLGRDRARDQARAAARALLVGLRVDAARVLLRGALLLPDKAREERFEEHTAAALGAPIPPSLLGVLPRLGPSDPTRLAGALLAARDRRDLVDRFDLDWFRNPRAALALREEDASVPSAPRASAESLAAGLAALERAVADV